MRITLDTNILVRAAVQDDAAQAAAATSLLREAELIALPLSCLCEFVWVMRRVYRVPADKVAGALRRLLGSANVVTDFEAAEAGLWLHDDGGDFADGVIEFDGRRMGATTFASFDRDAVRRMARSGLSAIVPAA